MFKTLIAVDGSEASDDAIVLAGQLLAGKHAEVTVIHVIARHVIHAKGGAAVAECYDPDVEQARSVELLEHSAQRLWELGVGATVKREIATGDPADKILAAAEQHEVDMIILGSRGLNVVRRFLVGSVSTKVANHARCAVLMVHPKQSGEVVTTIEEKEAVAV